MDNELIKACDLYSEICNRSKDDHPQGMSIGEIRKKYGLKKRDIVVLLQFLVNVTDFSYNVDFVKYNENGEPMGVDFSNYEESAEDGDIYVCIYDKKAYTLKNRVNETDINIQNSTFYYKLHQNNVDARLKEISALPEDSLEMFVINKGIKHKSVREGEKKLQLIYAILNRKIVNIACNNGIQKTVNPLGLRYMKLTDKYQLIYTENDGIIEEVSLSDLDQINISDETKNNIFDIFEYIKKKQTEKVVLQVYDEANVPKKLDMYLSEYDVQKEKKGTYIEYSFMAENAEIFENLIKSLGRSVIVQEPIYLREKIYQSAKSALEFYESDI